MPKKSSKKSITKAAPADFEKALNELEALVEKMEKGELPLEQALADFQRGIELSRACQETLQAAEQKVQILMAQNDKGQLAPFDPDKQA